MAKLWSHGAARSRTAAPRWHRPQSLPLLVLAVLAGAVPPGAERAAGFVPADAPGGIVHLDRLEGLEGLDRLDRLDRLDGLDRLDRVDRLGGLERPDRLGRFERPDWLGKGADIEGLGGLEGLETVLLSGPASAGGFLACSWTGALNLKGNSRDLWEKRITPRHELLESRSTSRRPNPDERSVTHDCAAPLGGLVDDFADFSDTDESTGVDGLGAPAEASFEGKSGAIVFIEDELVLGRMVALDQVAQCAVSVSASPAGSGTAAVTSGGETGDCGREVTVTATANEGWTFSAWSEGGAEVSSDAAYTFTLEADRTLTASFTEVSEPEPDPACTLSVSAQPPEGGTAAVTSGGATGDCGRSATVTATSDTGWIFVEWRSDGAWISFDPVHSLGVHTHRSLTARFVRAAEIANRLVRTLLQKENALTSSERSMLDHRGNDSGDLDIGDLLAFLEKNPGAAPDAMTGDPE